MKALFRVLAGASLAFVLAFAAFGLLACFEPMPLSTRLFFLTLYAAVAGGCLYGLYRLVRSGLHGPGRAAPVLLALVAGVAARDGRAAGLLVADGGFGGNLDLIEHTVDVTLNNGIAVTRVGQVFRNLENRQVEALYTFPVPKGASVSNFSMWIAGKEMVGEVVEKERARQIYDSYKQVRRDPGLLEQKNFKTFEMRIFPIAPLAEQRVEVTYYQELDQDHDRATYVYPLQTTTRGEQSQVKGTFAFNLRARSAVPLRSLASPSHGEAFVIDRHGDHAAQASLESRTGDLSRDIVLHLEYGRPVSGFDLLTSRPEGDDGFFLLQFTVGDDLQALDTGADHVFLLDISGSMADDRKLILSRDAVASFLDTLGPKDRVELLTFNVAPAPLFQELRDTDDATRLAIRAHLDTQVARGGTVLAPALTTAYRYANPDRPLNVVLISDGLTSPGERAELVRLIQARPRNTRVFCVGVGNEVNKPMMDQLTRLSGGLAAFLSPGDDLARAATAFRRKLAHPALAEARLQVEGVDVYSLEPAEPGAIFHGAPLRVFGRLRGEGEAVVTLAGTVQGQERTWRQTFTVPARADDHPEIERMWAQKRIARLEGEDPEGARAEMVRLGEAFSIVCQHTSFLVLENDGEYQRWKIDRRNALRHARDRRALETVRADLDRLRDEALAGLGPNPAPVKSARPAAPPAPVQVAQNTPVPTPRPASPSGPDFNWGGGSGPAGPLFLLALAALRRRRTTEPPTA
jgi:Ca-activated chloride channel family protein